MNVNGAGEGANLVAPHLAQDLITGKSDPFVLREIAQKLKFPSRKINRFAFSRNLSTANIHAD